MTQGDTQPSGSTSQRRVLAPPRAILLLLVLVEVRCRARADTLPCESKVGLASLLQAGKKPSAGATATQATTRHDSKRSISASYCNKVAQVTNCLLCKLCVETRCSTLLLFVALLVMQEVDTTACAETRRQHDSPCRGSTNRKVKGAKLNK